MARQLAWKISTLARSGTVRMPVVYGVMTHEEHPGPDVLLLERLRGVPVEAPTRTPARWEQLQEQIVEALLAWHRQDSGGCVGMVDNTQDNLWPNWYRQRVAMLWSTLNLYQDTGLTMQDKRVLFRSRECLPELFRDFNDNAVLVHGNFTLRSMLKDPRSDQLLAMVGPGMMLWAPREYELFRLAEGARPSSCYGVICSRRRSPRPLSGGAGFICCGMRWIAWSIPGALTAPVSTSPQNHSCPGSPELPFSHCQTRPSVS